MFSFPLGARVNIQYRKLYSMWWYSGLNSNMKFHYVRLGGDSDDPWKVFLLLLRLCLTQGSQNVLLFWIFFLTSKPQIMDLYSQGICSVHNLAEGDTICCFFIRSTYCFIQHPRISPSLRTKTLHPQVIS